MAATSFGSTAIAPVRFGVPAGDAAAGVGPGGGEGGNASAVLAASAGGVEAVVLLADGVSDLGGCDGAAATIAKVLAVR